MLLRREVTGKNVTLGRIAEKLKLFGITDKDTAVRNKLARGRFMVANCWQWLIAIQVENSRP